MVREQTQRDLDFMEAEQERSRKKAAERREDFVDANIGPVIEREGPKRFALDLGMGVENCDRIYQWRARRNGQRPPAELMVAAHEEDGQAFHEYCDYLRYERPKKLVLIPAAEQVRQLAAEAARRFGPSGEQMVRDVLGAPPPREEQEWEKKPVPPNGKAAP